MGGMFSLWRRRYSGRGIRDRIWHSWGQNRWFYLSGLVAQILFRPFELSQETNLTSSSQPNGRGGIFLVCLNLSEPSFPQKELLNWCPKYSRHFYLKFLRWNSFPAFHHAVVSLANTQLAGDIPGSQILKHPSKLYIRHICNHCVRVPKNISKWRNRNSFVVHRHFNNVSNLIS